MILKIRQADHAFFMAALALDELFRDHMEGDKMSAPGTSSECPQRRIFLAEQ